MSIPPEVKKTLLGSAATVVIAIVTAAVFIGGLLKSVETLGEDIVTLGKDLELVSQELARVRQDLAAVGATVSNAPITSGEDAGQSTDLPLPVSALAGSAQHFPNTVRWGSWSDAVYCAPNHYVCGLKQKAEPGRGSGTDDTAVNGIAFFCCPLVS